MATLDYRLVIRNENNTADALTFSTIAGAADEYTLAAPTGDGQSFDPIAGTFVIGHYTYQIIDADVGSGARAFSSNMADIAGRYHLISRVAVVSFSADRGATWEEYVGGFVNRIRKVGALLYELTIGDTQRIEKAITLFQKKSASFDKMSCLFGGPVRGGFGPIRDYGAWVMELKSVYNNHAVQFHFVSGYVRRSTDNVFFNFPTGGFALVEHSYTSYEEKKVNAIADPYRVGTPDFLPSGIGSSYPRLEARIEDMSGNLLGLFVPLNSRDPAYVVGAGWGAGTLHALLTGGDFCVHWGPTSALNPTDPNKLTYFPSRPSLHTQVKVICYALDVTDATPVHVQGHPVEIAAQCYADAGIAYDSASVAATTAAIGDNVRIACRPTKSMTMDAFLNSLQGLFGFAVRQQDGKRFFFSTRIRVATTPALTVTANDLKDASGVIFDQDEKSIINKVSVALDSYKLWAPEKHGKDSTRPVDEIVTTPNTVNVFADASAQFQVHEQVYAMQGELYGLHVASTATGVQFLVDGELPLADFALAMAKGAGSIFDRRARGAIVGELHCIRGGPGGLEAAELGDEIYCEVPWQQNKNGIGGNRIVQVTKRTEEPSGPVFMVEDSGTTAQPATLPTFTFAKDSSTDPKRYAVITLTNAAALITEGDNVRIELGAGASPSSYMLLVLLTVADMVAGRTALRLPRLDAGSVHTVRMRSESAAGGIRPSAYTLPLTCVLDALVPPTSLSIIGQPDDSTIAVVSWTIGETLVPIEVRYRVTGDTAWRIAIAAAGSSNIAIGTLSLATEYDFDVRHHEVPPYDGVSASISATFTTSNVVRTLLAPDNPSAFSGSIDSATGSFINDGTYGLEVTAREFPESIEFHVAIETSPGAGTYGSYVEPPRSVQDAAQEPARTRFTAVAPGDGLRRRMQARAVRFGATSSAWTDAVDVLPFIPQRPTDYPVPAPAITLGYETIQIAGSLRAIILVNFATPTQSQYGDMEYKVRSRIPGGTWGAYAKQPGTKLGPDTIPAQFGLEYGVTPVTITAKDGVRSTDGVEVTLTIPAAAADGVVSSTGDVDTMNVTVMPNAVASFYRIYSVRYTSTPSPIPDTVEDPANYVGPDRDISVTYFELPVDAINTDRVVTLVFYDQNGVKGNYETTAARYNASASPPGTPTLATFSNAANDVEIDVTMDGAATAGDVLVFRRGGVQIGLHTVTSGEATANTARLTDASAVATATYSYTVLTHRTSDGLFSAESAADAVTVASGGTLTAPTVSTGIDSGDPCASFLVTPHAGAGNPVGTVYDIYTSSSSGGTYTLAAGGIAAGSATSVTRPGGQHASSYAKAKARKTGYTTSGFSSVGSIGPTPSGTRC